ncbi:MAG: AAA family ATPase [bacterium]|nr:AAA family ATPase [bacterium]
MPATDQRDVLALLARPAAYPHAAPEPVHVQTHISHVFLAGAHVYKLKKAAQLPFVDQSTTARRAALCTAEVELNRQLAAPVYLGCVTVTRERDGRLALGGGGTPVETLVHMRRLPDQRALARLVERGLADVRMMTAIAQRLAAFHTTAPSGAGAAREGTRRRVRANWDRVLALTASLPPAVLRPLERRLLTDAGPTVLGARAACFDRRRARGRIREGHGDLHAEQVYVLATALPALPPYPRVPAGPWLVDRLEFSQALRCCDVASEVAFLAMDLERLGRRDLGDAFVAAYRTASGDTEIDDVLPFYVAYRACIRGAVEGMKAQEPEVDAADAEAARVRARRFFAVALQAVWRTGPPPILACAGPSGSGKSTVAEALAAATGFAHVSSDRLRKQRAGLRAGERARRRRLTRAARAAVYDALGRAIGRQLAAGRGVVADATFLRREERARLAAVAARHGAPLCFVACDARPATIRSRLATRPPGWSDATWEVYVRQQQTRDPFAPDELVITLDTNHERTLVADAALAACWSWYGRHALPRSGRRSLRQARR